MDIMTELFTHLQGRSRPEEVAECVLRALGPALDARSRAIVDRAARRSYARAGSAYSSMASEFFRAVVQPAPQVRLVHTLFASVADLPVLSADECRDPARLEVFVRETSALIHRAWGSRARLDKRARRALGLFKGHRWYNKRFRLLLRIEDKIARMLRADRRFDLVRVSKSSLATRLPRAVFEEDLASACFVAYLASRMSLRSVFTNGSQERAYDEIAEVLLHHALSGAPSWFALAHVHPERAFCPADDVPEDPQSGAATCAPWGEKPAQRRA
jgi:hypothetical protein